jgi:hypothetical protein
MPSKTFAHGGHAAARGITLRQLESRIRIARVDGAAEEVHGGGIVLRDAAAGGVTQANLPPSSSDPTYRAQMWGADLHQNVDGSATIMLRHVDRTAEVRVNEAGKIEFEFTDL